MSMATEFCPIELGDMLDEAGRPDCIGSLVGLGCGGGGAGLAAGDTDRCLTLGSGMLTGGGSSSLSDLIMTPPSIEPIQLSVGDWRFGDGDGRGACGVVLGLGVGRGDCRFSCNSFIVSEVVRPLAVCSSPMLASSFSIMLSIRLFTLPTGSLLSSDCCCCCDCWSILLVVFWLWLSLRESSASDSISISCLALAWGDEATLEQLDSSDWLLALARSILAAALFSLDDMGNWSLNFCTSISSTGLSFILTIMVSTQRPSVYFLSASNSAGWVCWVCGAGDRPVVILDKLVCSCRLIRSFKTL
ncbi:hypothetical protein BpHYR1_004191 [Brachionus plicatilis]|uniref:Uncharacterized protein n=1 Tax=Brachionus plicatilis TaxID=10195 RepID=A0A3M7SYB8_BRAPC|nr:hypothetical protein BpHYR1_004191 [Brachionus plicatilis]